MRAILLSALLLVVVIGCGKKPDAAATPEGNRNPSAVPSSPLPQATVNAWLAAGWQPGWMGLDDKGWLGIHSTRSPIPSGAIPYFSQTSLSSGGMSGLPDPGVPFGISLNYSRSDAPLKELTSFKNVARLILGENCNVTDAGLKEVTALPNLTALNMSSRRVTVAGLKQLAESKTLVHLLLSGEVSVTDAGLMELVRLKTLNTLNLYNSKLITDAGMKSVAKIKSLRTLSLASTPVTDAGLKELSQLKDLTLLDLAHTKVTDAGVAELQKALPNCKITR